MITALMIVLLVVFIGLFGAMLVVLVPMITGALRGQPPVERRAGAAMVIAKKEMMVAGRPVTRVVFQLNQGGMLDLLVTESQAGAIVRGEYGVVHWAGEYCSGWVPELGSATPTDSHRAD